MSSIFWNLSYCCFNINSSYNKGLRLKALIIWKATYSSKLLMRRTKFFFKSAYLLFSFFCIELLLLSSWIWLFMGICRFCWLNASMSARWISLYFLVDKSKKWYEPISSPSSLIGSFTYSVFCLWKSKLLHKPENESSLCFVKDRTISLKSLF